MAKNKKEVIDEDEESLKALYEELDLTDVILIAIDTRPEDYYSTQPSFFPYGGEVIKLDGLNKKMSFFELLEKIVTKLKWPADEIRIWDQCQYDEFLAGKFDVFCKDEYRDYIPQFISMRPEEIVYPLFLSGQQLVIERKAVFHQPFPSSPQPQILSQREWWKGLCEDWKCDTLSLNKTVYKNVEIIRMERNQRNNSLFNALGFLFHIVSNIKGEEDVDDMKEGLTLPSRFRAAKVRKEIARFVTDYYENIEKTSLLGSRTVKEYVATLLDPYYSGGDLEFIFAAIQHGALIQVFDIESQKMRQYGKGFVENYINPNRLSEKFSVKLVRWANNFYEPITFSLQPGMNPDRQENPYCMAYAEIAFNWMQKQPKNRTEAQLQCSNCHIEENPDQNFQTCGDCQSTFYCGEHCQILHWKNIHKGVCQKRDFDEESKNSFEEEKNAFSEIAADLDERRNCKIGMRKIWAEIQ